MHILLIEDDINAASYVIKGLKESGHVVDHASDGEEGMDLSLSLIHISEPTRQEALSNEVFC